MTVRAPARFRRPRAATIGVAAVFAIAATLLPGATSAQAAEAPSEDKGIVLETLSNRADLVFDGNALVRVTLPKGSSADDLRVWLDDTRHTSSSTGDRDVTSAFAKRPNGEIEGVVRGLRVGTNELTARLPDGRGAWLTITNHPRGGPVFSGPQLQPWRCQPGAKDEQCNQEPEISWLYKSTNALLDGLQPYDPANPPADVASTTTDEGLTVPFVVRVETGYQNRDQYRIAVLWEPGKAWKRWQPQQQWNNKLFIPHGGSCGVDHQVGEAPTKDYAGTFDLGVPVVADALGDSPTVALGRGFAMLSTALANTGHNCNVASEAESLMMAKEHLVETYGDLRYTIGSGCSGGSIAQQTIANAYPGIYQGLVVTCSYPDSLSPGLQFSDYHLLRKYFESSERATDGKFWNPLQWAAVEGHLLPLNAVTADEGLFKQAVVPTHPCAGVSDKERYDAQTNPGGVRCSIIDGGINVFGPRPRSVWTDQEKQIGRGFAGSPLDNTGVQYGLEALRSGAITPEQFVDVNEKIGGLDIDIQPRSERSVADPTSLANTYRSGMVNTASNLSEVAIIDHRGPDPGIAHDARWAWAMRDRLTREQGHADNQVIWYGATPLIGDPSYSKEALLAMDRWLTAVESDDRGVPLSDKVVQDRPGDLHDRCTQTQGVSSKDGLFVPVADPLLDDLTGGALDGLNGALNPVLDPALNLVVDPVSDLVCGLGPVSDLIKTDFATPRIVAGDNNYSDNAKCHLKPLRRTDDYGTFGLSDAQWTRLQTAFPGGVCDYSKPGVGFSKTVTWLTYQRADGSVVYGGTPMGNPPRSESFRDRADRQGEGAAASDLSNGATAAGTDTTADVPAGNAGTLAGSVGSAESAGSTKPTGSTEATRTVAGLPDTGAGRMLRYALAAGIALIAGGVVLLRRSQRAGA